MRGGVEYFIRCMDTYANDTVKYQSMSATYHSMSAIFQRWQETNLAEEVKQWPIDDVKARMRQCSQKLTAITGADTNRSKVSNSPGMSRASNFLFLKQVRYFTILSFTALALIVLTLFVLLVVVIQVGSLGFFQQRGMRFGHR